MKLMLHKLNAAIAHIAQDDQPPAFKMLDTVLFPEIWTLRTAL